MEKYAWNATVKAGSIDEYIRRHENLPPEMVEILKKAGIANYTIWNVGNELFGYYECEKGIQFAAEIQANSDVVRKWDAYMSDILVMEKDPITKAQPLLKKVFELE